VQRAKSNRRVANPSRNQRQKRWWVSLTMERWQPENTPVGVRS
jgi:hypothetical protein